MQFLGYKNSLFRFRADIVFSLLVKCCACLVIVFFLLMIATLFFRSLPVFLTPSYVNNTIKTLSDEQTPIAVTRGGLILHEKTHASGAGREQCKLHFWRHNRNERGDNNDLVTALTASVSVKNSSLDIGCDSQYWTQSINNTHYLLVLKKGALQVYLINNGFEYQLGQQLDLPSQFTQTRIDTIFLQQTRIVISNRAQQTLLIDRPTQSIGQADTQQVQFEQSNVAQHYWSGDVFIARDDIIKVLSNSNKNDFEASLAQGDGLISLYSSHVPYQIYSVDKHTSTASGQRITAHHLLNADAASAQNVIELDPNALFGQDSLQVLAIIESDIHNLIHVVVKAEGLRDASPQMQVLLYNNVTYELLNHYEFTYPARFIGSSQNNLLFEVANNQTGTRLVNQLSIDTPQAAVTFEELFTEHQTPGYATPEKVWQTNPALDYQVHKYNIAPLLMGSLKVSLLAVIVALPVSLGAAIYLGYFAHPKMRNYLKPIIETLESIPAVILGLLASIVFLPFADSFLISLIVFLLLLPLFFVLIALLYQLIKRYQQHKWFERYEFLLMLTFFFSYVFLCFYALPQLLNSFQLLQQNTVDKSTLVIGLALGLAIAPTIFSLAEDAINGVPDAMKKAAFALGASRIETLVHIVLYTAFPGIVAAVMLGLGRAFGETMIVLVVSGNTAIASWDLLESVRALTANLVIEMPEATQSNSHATVLFFTALLLFLFTFVVNTCAELMKRNNQKLQDGTND